MYMAEVRAYQIIPVIMLSMETVTAQSHRMKEILRYFALMGRGVGCVAVACGG